MNTTHSHDTRVPDMIGSLSELDILAIQQYSDHQGTSGRQPEKKLDVRRFVRCGRMLSKISAFA
jgi:hypothetical protein